MFHPDVRTFEVRNRKSGEVVGLFYMDNYARDGKRSGAWATTYRSRSGLLGDKIVLASNNNNFTKPGPGEPVLISLDDAETLFHEFGHAHPLRCCRTLIIRGWRGRRATSSNIRAR